MSNILVMCDKKVAGTFIKQVLEQSGYEVTHVASATEAQNSLASTRFDLVIADMQDSSDSAELIIKLKKKTDVIPAIMIANKSDVRSVRASRADKVVYRPFESEPLLSAVKKLLG